MFYISSMFDSYRANSTESDTAAEVPAEPRSKAVGRGGTSLQRKGSLLRKTLSLEQTSNAQDQVRVDLLASHRIQQLAFTASLVPPFIDRPSEDPTCRSPNAASFSAALTSAQ